MLLMTGGKSPCHRQPSLTVTHQSCSIKAVATAAAAAAAAASSRVFAFSRTHNCNKTKMKQVGRSGLCADELSKIYRMTLP